MAELAWPADLGHGTFTGRFGFMDADTHDPDRDPDVTSATGGKATITPSIKSVRYTGTDGPMILAARAAQGVINSEGYLCTTAEDGTAGDVGMVFPATDDTDLTPTDWTYQVTVTLDGGVRLPSFNVKLPTGSTVDLSLAVPVDTSGGTAVVVDPTTATRAEAAATRAETAATEAEDWAPSFVWDGTQLVIDGGAPVDLKGEKGDGSAWADLTGKPATYPPATHTHPITDVDGLKAIIDRLGYDSGWRALCRWSGGTVTQGVLPSGLAPRGNNAGGVFVRRNAHTVTVAVVEANVTALSPEIPLPAGFRGAGRTGVPYPAVPIYYRDANLDAKLANAEFGVGFVRFRDVPAGATLSAAGTGGYGVVTTVPSENALPTTLPGDPA